MTREHKNPPRNSDEDKHVRNCEFALTSRQEAFAQLCGEKELIKENMPRAKHNGACRLELRRLGWLKKKAEVTAECSKGCSSRRPDNSWLARTEDTVRNSEL